MEAHERLLKLRKNWQAQIKRLEDLSKFEVPDWFTEQERKSAYKNWELLKDSQVLAYKRCIGDIENYYGFEMDMLEKSLNEQEKSGDEGAWEKFMRE